MIGYLRGEILENSEGKILIGVGSAGSPVGQSSGLVGYLVSVPQSATYGRILPVNSTSSSSTHMFEKMLLICMVF